jgi:diguanylate cyclase (GGDEF)-like protein
MLLLFVVGIVIYVTLGNQEAVVKNEQYRTHSFSLAVELIQSTDDLSNLARSYVSTGNQSFKKRYSEILDIRNGTRPRPKHYTSPYWYISGRGVVQSVSPDEIVPWQTLANNEEFQSRELALLRDAKVKADGLVSMEKQAFSDIEGLHDDGYGNFSMKGIPNREAAIGLLYSAKYSELKDSIILPIRQFMDRVDKRTETQQSILSKKMQYYILFSVVLVFAALFFMAVLLGNIFINILHPLDHLRHQVTGISEGNYSARCDIHSGSEIGELCIHFNNMAEIIEKDILRHEQDEERIRHMAQHDSLTGLPNRILFGDRLKRAIAAAKRNKTSMAVMCLDLDKFKSINDTLGHGAGDAMLQEASRRMQHCIRDADTVARIGGDEFIVLLQTVSKEEDALLVAEKIRRVLTQPFDLEGHKRTISCSIGISIYPIHGIDEIGLIKNADSALYTAKECGRNNVQLFNGAEQFSK